MQTEAVGTLLRVQAILDEESAAAAAAAAGQPAARVQQEQGPSLEQVFEEYVAPRVDRQGGDRAGRRQQKTRQAEARQAEDKAGKRVPPWWCHSSRVWAGEVAGECRLGSATADACGTASHRVPPRYFVPQVEDVLQLSEELLVEELPDDFRATALRELEQEVAEQPPPR